MCRFYCTSEGPSTNLKCLHCGIYYCGACLHGEKGKMENLIKCAGCGKKPRTADTSNRGGWKGEGVNSFAGGTGHVSDSDRTLVNGLRPDQNGSPKRSASSKGKKGPSIFDKLTDSSLYTGAHKHRFDADGKGRGMAGRDAASGITYDGTGGGLTLSKLADRSASDARGLPVALSKVTSGGSPARSKSPAPVRSPSQASSAPRGSAPQYYDEEVKPAPKKAASSKGKKGPSIFDKLTDSSLYTGAHKHRFDASGKGRGMAGRDAASGIAYDGSGGGLTLSQLANRGAADARGLPVTLNKFH